MAIGNFKTATASSFPLLEARLRLGGQILPTNLKVTQ